LTLCYRIDVKDVVFVSTALRNPDDKDDPLLAKYGALQRMLNNHVITLRRSPRSYSVRTYLRYMFSR